MINNTRGLSRGTNTSQPQSKATSTILNKWQQNSGDFGMQGMLRKSIEAKVNKQNLSTPTASVATAPPVTVDPMALENTGTMLNTVEPGIKPSGAPVSFSPRAQSAITSAFGNPVANSYDRTVGGPVPITDPNIDSNWPQNNL
jgi:hypothetical protein